MAPLTLPSVAAEDLDRPDSISIDNTKGPTMATTNSITSSSLPDLDASALVVNRTTHPKPTPGPADIATMNCTTDHMITCIWTAGTGWQTPQLRPYGPLTLLPTASVLHYATECFEGMKCYRGHDGHIRLFRPDQNCIRMRRSATRIALPTFDPSELQALIRALVTIDAEKWLPKSGPGTFLYLRPTLIGTEPGLALRPPTEALLYIIALRFPVMNNNEPQGTSSPNSASAAGLKLLASSEDMVRAWPGGFGFAKVGANYGPCFAPQAEAIERGYDQILWLLGPRNEVTEAGASNFFVVWVARDGKLQLVTAPLEDRIILDGITRKSVLDLARTRLQSSTGSLKSLEVVERKFSMDDVEEALSEGRLVEAFVCGTAYFITAVSHIHYRGRGLDIPASKGVGGGSTYAEAFKGWLTDIIYGKEQHEWGVVVEDSKRT